MDWLERSMNPPFGVSDEDWNGGWGKPKDQPPSYTFTSDGPECNRAAPEPGPFAAPDTEPMEQKTSAREQSFLERNPEAVVAAGALLAAGFVWGSMALGKAIQRKIDPNYDQWCRENERAGSTAKSSKIE